MTDVSAGENLTRTPRSGVFHNWRYVLATTNPPPGRLDPVSKWLYLTRAGVLPMTLVAGAVAGLLAVYRGDDVSWGWYALAVVGIVGAHMANNLMNDLFDLGVGTDREDYPRNLYSPHPVLAGVITRRGLALCALVVNVICLAIMLVLTYVRGWPILAFALGGFVLSAAYTAPPLRLKKRGLGEPTVLVVWGPLMVGGTYYTATGSIPGAVILASLPYAILCTTVLMGKHIDKIPWDAPDGTHTLPVIIGEKAARRVTQGMFVAFYVSIVALVIARVLPVASLLVFLSLPMLRGIFPAYNKPKPEKSPMPNPVWPLYFAALSFVVTRRAGGLFVLGLIVGAILKLVTVPAYVIYQGEILDQARHDEYKVKGAESILAAGGRYVVRGGDFEVLEGDAPAGRTVVLEFPTRQAALDWYYGDAYTEIRKIRDGAAIARMYVIDGAPDSAP